MRGQEGWHILESRGPPTVSLSHTHKSFNEITFCSDILKIPEGELVTSRLFRFRMRVSAEAFVGGEMHVQMKRR